MVLKLRLLEELNHSFLLRKLSSMNIASVLKVSLEITLEGISFLTKTIIPPPNSFRSRRKGDLKPGILNWPSGNDSSSLISDIAKMSTFPLI